MLDLRKSADSQDNRYILNTYNQNDVGFCTVRESSNKNNSSFKSLTNSVELIRNPLTTRHSLHDCYNTTMTNTTFINNLESMENTSRGVENTSCGMNTSRGYMNLNSIESVRSNQNTQREQLLRNFEDRGKLCVIKSTIYTFYVFYV